MQIMKEEQTKEYFDKLGTQIYICGTIAITLKALFNFSEIINIPSVFDLLLQGIFLVCMFTKILHQSYSKKSLILIVGFGLCCFLTYYKAHYYYLISSYLCLVTIQRVDLKKVLKVSSILKLSFLAVHVAIYAVAYFKFPQIINYSYRNGVQRHQFLMSHANTFSMLVTWASIEYIYSHYEKISRLKLILLLILNFAVYYFTDSNTSFIVTTLVILCIVADKSKKTILLKGIHWLSKYSFALCSIFFPLLIVGYVKYYNIAGRLFELLDKIFTGRLLYGAYVYGQYGWTIFGRSIDFPKKSYWNGFWFDEIGCDNTFLWLFVCYGSLYLLLLSLAFIKIAKDTSNIEKIVILAYVFYGVMEAYIINAVFCFPVLFIGKYIFDSKKNKNLVEKT